MPGQFEVRLNRATPRVMCLFAIADKIWFGVLRCSISPGSNGILVCLCFPFAKAYVMPPRALEASNFRCTIFGKVALSEANKATALFLQAFSPCRMVCHDVTTCCGVSLFKKCTTLCTCRLISCECRCAWEVWLWRFRIHTILWTVEFFFWGKGLNSTTPYLVFNFTA